MKNSHHIEILNLIRHHAVKPTQHTYLDSYLGNNHPRYPIDIPTLRKIAKDWMRLHDNLNHTGFAKLLTSLIEANSSTEKSMAGILLDYATVDQRKFNPKLFNSWLEHLEGWAEVDALCTGNYSALEVYNQWKSWKPLLIQFSKSKNINKRRASLVLLCSPLRKWKDAEALIEIALENVDRLKEENDIRITKAISWILRTMEKHYRKILIQYLEENKETLPKIAVRETLTKLNTGIKNSRK